MRPLVVLLGLIGAGFTPAPTAPDIWCCIPWHVNNAALDAACQDDCVASTTCTANTWEALINATCQTYPDGVCTLQDAQFTLRKYDCQTTECTLQGGGTGVRCTRNIVDTKNVTGKKCQTGTTICPPPDGG